MHSRKEILGNVIKYLFSTILSQSLLIFRGIIVPGLLGPTKYGVLSGLQLIPTWGNYLHLGVNYGLERETCLGISKGNLEDTRLFRSSAFRFVFIMSSLGAVVIWLFTFYQSEQYPIVILWGFRVFALVMFFQNLQLTITSIARTENLFNLISKGQILKGVIVAISDILLVYLFGLYGLFISLFITSLTVFLYFLHPTFIFLKLKICYIHLKNMLKIGVPLLISGFLITFQNSIDKIMILSFLNVEQLGLYSLGIQLVSYIYLIPHQIAWVLVTYIYKFSEDISDVSEFKKVLFLPTFITSVITAIISGIVIILLPGLLFLIIPKFILGMLVIKILIVGIFFRTLSINANAVIVALKRQNSYLKFTLIACIIAVLSNYLFIKLGMGIKGVAIATALSYFIFSNILLIYTSSIINVSFHDLLFFLFKVYVPMLWCVFITISIEKFIGIRMEMPTNTIIVLSCIKLGLFFILFSPIILWLDKETNIIKESYLQIKRKITSLVFNTFSV